MYEFLLTKSMTDKNSIDVMKDFLRFSPEKYIKKLNIEPSENEMKYFIDSVNQCKKIIHNKILGWNKQTKKYINGKFSEDKNICLCKKFLYIDAHYSKSRFYDSMQYEFRFLGGSYSVSYNGIRWVHIGDKTFNEYFIDIKIIKRNNKIDDIFK